MCKNKPNFIISVILLVFVVTLPAFCDPNLVGWWKFDEIGGNLAIDSSGNGYNGTITGAARIMVGADQYALDFEGTDYVIIPVEVFSSIDKKISISLWQYGDENVQPQDDSIFEGRNSSGNRVINSHIPWGSENIFFDAGYDDGSYDRCYRQATSPDEYKGQWNHWVFTKDADAGEMKMYLNGVLWHSVTGKTKAISGISSFVIGARADLGENYDGMIDDFRIYDSVLSEEQVQRLAGLETVCDPQGPDMNGDCFVDLEDIKLMAQSWLVSDYVVIPTFPNYNHLQAFYMFNEGSGNIAHDSSPHGRDAVIEANDVSTIWASDQRDTWICFDGSFGISIPQEVFENISSGLTISAWVNTAADSITSVDFSAGSTDPNTRDSVSWQTEDANGLPGNWVHYAFVKDSETGMMRIYRNAEVIAYSSSSTQSVNSSGTSYIGANLSGTGDYFVGMMNNFQVYNYPLSHSEVLLLALSAVGGEVNQSITPYIVPVDPYEDGTINYRDFSVIAESWLKDLLFD